LHSGREQKFQDIKFVQTCLSLCWFQSDLMDANMVML
jgi:hypothetical protein